MILMVTDTVEALMAEARRQFVGAHFPEGALDARILVGGMLGFSNTELMVRGAEPVSAENAARIRAGIVRRLGHEPVYRILGSRAFYGLELKMSADTLEPRPDTEMLVDSMLPYMRKVIAQKGTARLLDAGTGTGAIGLALLQECPEATGVGSDVSTDAVGTARQNAVANGLTDRFEAVVSDWMQAIEGQFDVIVSNPPYVLSGIVLHLAEEVRGFDPLIALDGGPDGLTGYKAIAADAGKFLVPDGVIGVEIGYDQKKPVTQVFEAQGFVLLDAVRDLGGNDRVLVFHRGTAG
jgi:release factor glutamine methyltransferase